MDTIRFAAGKHPIGLREPIFFDDYLKFNIGISPACNAVFVPTNRPESCLANTKRTVPVDNIHEATQGLGIYIECPRESGDVVDVFAPGVSCLLCVLFQMHKPEIVRRLIDRLVVQKKFGSPLPDFELEPMRRWSVVPHVQS